MDAVWLEVTVETTGAELDSLSARLTGNGATGLVIEDEEDFKSFLEQNRQYWDYVDDQLLERMKGAARIKFYVTDDADGQGQLAKWMEGIDLPYTTARLRENDWATSWQKYYKPMAVGQRLYIVPEWERGEAVPDGRTALYLNPGLTFGTGSHASTRLCLEWVEEFAREGESALDLGCGSGILSIAALLLGSREAVGVDIDPKAEDMARENGAYNGMSTPRFQAFTGDVAGDPRALAALMDAGGPFDLALINIVANVILALTPSLRRLLRPGGAVICSGILDSRLEEVQACLQAHGFRILETRSQAEWRCLTARLEEEAP